MYNRLSFKDLRRMLQSRENREGVVSHVCFKMAQTINKDYHMATVRNTSYFSDEQPPPLLTRSFLLSNAI